MSTVHAPRATWPRPRIRRPNRLTILWSVCLFVGLALLGTFAYGMWSGVAQQRHLDDLWRQQPASRQVGPRQVDPALQRSVDGIDFAILVPRLGYSAAVREGVDPGILYSGPGHYPQTKWPGSAGTVAIAAHNVYWINFPELTRGDEIDLDTRYGVYRYRITGSEVVDPSNRTVIQPSAGGYRLTLTTCWPLWAGAFATRRYVIFADQVWPAPFAPGYT